MPISVGYGGQQTGPQQTAPFDLKGVTALGQPITHDQVQVAEILLGVGQQLNAPDVAMVAIIYAALGETDLGAAPNTYTGGAGGAVGVLQGTPANWPNAHDVQGQATCFYKGGKGFQAGGAIALAQQGWTAWKIANAVEANYTFDASGGDSYAGRWPGGTQQGIDEAKRIASRIGGVSIDLAGVAAGLGGTGEGANPTLTNPFYVGDSTNPDQDYWTTINQYCQDAQWYCFSDGESLYVADGTKLMAQTPALVIDWRDPKVVSLEVTYDNSSFQFAIDRRAKVGVQRKATLPRTTSPTGGTLKLICDIDEYRAGDTVYLLGVGPANGLWLIGECNRDCFQPYSTLTLVQGQMPLSAETGYTVGANQSATAQTRSRLVPERLSQGMIAYATKITTDQYPYVWGGGHAHAGTPSTGEPGAGYDGTKVGFDCSGLVGALFAAVGLGLKLGDPIGNNDSLITQLTNAGVLQSGQGDPTLECTVFNIPGQHIYARLCGQYFAAQQPGVPDGFYKNGSVLPGSVAYHVPQATLKEYTTGSGATSNNGSAA